MSPLTLALTSATATTLLTAAVIGWLRSLPGGGHGVAGWLIAFLLFALAWAAGLLAQFLAPPITPATVLLQLLAAAALFCGIRVFFGLHPLRTLVCSIAGLIIAGYLLASILDTGGGGWLLWGAVTVTALLLFISGGPFVRMRPHQLRSGHLITAVALGAHALAVAAWSPPGSLSVAGVMTGQVLLLALAPGMANVVHQRIHQRLSQAERRLAHAIEALDQGFALYGAE